MNVITYRVYLEQPLLATQILGDPNSSVSFDFIPGSQIRGMLVHRYRERTGVEAARIATDPACRRLFFDGRTRYLHAYPSVGQSGVRALPAPLALLVRKHGDRRHCYNAAHKDFDRDEAEGQDSLKPLGRTFGVLEDEAIALCKEQPNRLAVHIRRHRGKGRATDEDGDIFQYDALASGRWFGGVVITDTDEDDQLLRELLDGPAWLGRSRSAGYGKVRIELEPKRTSAWREVGGTVSGLPAGLPATLTLLSDAILRDAQGSAVMTLDNTTLGAYLGVAVAIHDTHTFSAGMAHGGFNRTWRLPLVQEYALVAGTTVVFSPQSPLDAASVRRLEEQGIGERRAEGFGRVAFGWLTAERLRIEEERPYPGREAPRSLSPASRMVAQQMAQRLLDLLVEERIAGFVRDQVTPHAGQMPHNSQLGRVRVLLRRAIRSGYDFAAVRRQLDTFKETSRRQFEQARLANTSLWDWLTALLADPPTRDVWDVLGVPRHDWPVVAGERAAPDAAMTRAVTARLVEAVLTGASRERKRTEDAR